MRTEKFISLIRCIYINKKQNYNYIFLGYELIIQNLLHEEILQCH